MTLDEDLKARLARVRGYLVDMDGTLYIAGGVALPGAVGFVEALDAAGRPRVVLTNNSSKRGEVYVERLAKLGLSVTRDDVLTSGDAAAAWLARETELRRPFVVGTDALADACRRAGLVPTAYADGPDCVLLGYDLDLTYRRLSEACLLVARGLPYYATHLDRTCIDSEGLLPDAGAIAAAIETTTSFLPDGGRRPVVLGKPTTAMLDAGLARLGCARDEVLIVGDQLDTDMTLGVAHGVLCALVLTGETDRLKLARSAVKPDLVCESVGAVHAALVQSGALPPSASAAAFAAR